MVAERMDFHAEYRRRSGPGAELDLILRMVWSTSSSDMGVSMTSGVAVGHNGVGGAQLEVSLPACCLAVKKSLIAVKGTGHLRGGGDFLISVMHFFGWSLYSF